MRLTDNIRSTLQNLAIPLDDDRESRPEIHTYVIPVSCGDAFAPLGLVILRCDDSRLSAISYIGLLISVPSALDPTC